jgi:hypothetical protein
MLQETMVYLTTATPPPADIAAITGPIVGLLETIFTALIPLVGALGAIYCIFLGVKLAKADEQQEREKAKIALKNAVIGFVLIFVLVVALRIGIPVMSEWAAGNTA